MDEQEKAFVIGSIDYRIENEKELEKELERERKKR